MEQPGEEERAVCAQADTASAPCEDTPYLESSSW